jgi:hypothetical protein
MEKNKTSFNGLGLGTILFLIFLTLKLGGWGSVANWSWWWVTSPLWIPLCIILVILMIYGLVVYIKNNS